MNGGGGSREREYEIFERFSGIVRTKFSSLANDPDGGAQMKRIDDLYKSPEFDAEKRALHELNGMGLWKGVAAGLGTFAFLRLGPGAFSRMILRRAGGGGANPFHRPSSGYKFDLPAAAGQQPGAKPPGLLFRLVRLSVDAFVSVSVGGYASLYFVDKDEMMSKFSEIPLIEGRSLLAEELCGDFANEFRRFDRETWDERHKALTGGAGISYPSNSDDGNSDFRDTIQGFVANCRRREMYEGELRRERGMGGREPLAIPSGGVPRDASVSLDDLMGAKGFDGVDGVDGADGNLQVGDDFFDTSFDMGGDGKDNSSKPPTY